MPRDREDDFALRVKNFQPQRVDPRKNATSQIFWFDFAERDHIQQFNDFNTFNAVSGIVFT